ncbi:MAG: F0F1 ATP synthase subunit B [Armatimonadetes bacterium]|nr:F0F1 ATP synthase subunit B [Armatimonadota bacterium]NIO98879.1 F0F1 ATP synthase subunit B [Armatimonadota bacterium]
MEGLAGLGINVPILLAQIVNVAILLVVLYFVAYKPVMRMLDQRSRRIKDSMEQADAVKEQAARTEEEVKKQLEAAGREGQKRIAQAAKAGEEIREKARQSARQEAEALITRARGEIQRERDEAISELRKEVADLTISAAEKVIDRSLDKKAHRELIEKVMEESDALKEK